jgi:hypothetical protein
MYYKLHVKFVLVDINVFKIHSSTVNFLREREERNQKGEKDKRKKERSNLFTLLIVLQAKPIFPCCVLDKQTQGVFCIAALSTATVMGALSYRKPTCTWSPSLPYSLPLPISSKCTLKYQELLSRPYNF